VKWEGEETTATSLLKRTVFYKVGHHGSENATLSEKGMELMPDGLLAMMPVNEVQAHAKRWNDMPYDKLIKGLADKNGVLIRLDTASETDAPQGTKVTDLFVEYELKV
jgi:hypothetical protein